MSGLTPLGERTLAGFIKKWGPDKGPLKFQDALDNGLIDRGKMENVGLADTGDEGMGGAPEEGSPAEEDAESPDEAAMEDDAPAGPPPAGMMAMLGRSSEAKPAPPRKSKSKKRPPLPARGAPGAFQKRPG